MYTVLSNFAFCSSRQRLDRLARHLRSQAGPFWAHWTQVFHSILWLPLRNVRYLYQTIAQKLVTEPNTSKNIGEDLYHWTLGQSLEKVYAYWLESRMPVQDRMTRWWIPWTPPEMWRRMQPLNLEFSNRWTGTSCDLWYLVMFIPESEMIGWTDGWIDGWMGMGKLDERLLGLKPINVKPIPSLPVPATAWSWLLSHFPSMFVPFPSLHDNFLLIPVSCLSNPPS